MMTREEAVKHLTAWIYTDFENMPKHVLEALNIALTALRPVSRERVERLWPVCPECEPRCTLCVNMNAWDKYGKPYACERCENLSNFDPEDNFCCNCGRSLTESAAQMIVGRLEAIQSDHS